MQTKVTIHRKYFQIPIHIFQNRVDQITSCIDQELETEAIVDVEDDPGTGSPVRGEGTGSLERSEGAGSLELREGASNLELVEGAGSLGEVAGNLGEVAGSLELGEVAGSQMVVHMVKEGTQPEQESADRAETSAV